MKLTKRQQQWIGGVGAAVLGVLGLKWWLGSRHERQPAYYLPGNEAHVYQGQAVVLRLPAGAYQMLGGQDLVTMLSQTPRGVNTDIALQIGGAPNPFTVIPRFVDTTRPGAEYNLIITAVPANGGT